MFLTSLSRCDLPGGPVDVRSLPPWANRTDRRLVSTRAFFLWIPEEDKTRTDNMQWRAGDLRGQVGAEVAPIVSLAERPPSVRVRVLVGGGVCRG